MNAPEKALPGNDGNVRGDDDAPVRNHALRPEDLKWDVESTLADEAMLSEKLVTETVNTDPGATGESEAVSTDELLQIDRVRLKKQGFIVPDGPRTTTIQEFRGVKRSLLLNAVGAPADDVNRARLIMITSALPGEGKTFCAVNLALSLVEEKDYTVLLVDGDVARPSIPERLGLPELPGLIDALADPGIDVRSLIRQTSIPKLTYLSAGRAHHQATELLASSLMDDLLDSLLGIDKRQIIIFDSPPLLVSTEAPGLPPRMGQIVLVVETGNTRRSAVKDALTMIDRDDDSVSILLNKASSGRSASGYSGYGYGYGYGRKG